MKKISFYMMALLSLVLTACNDDFATEFVPQTNAPESTFPMNAVSVTATAKAIDLVTLLAADEEQPIEVGTISLAQPLPANTVLRGEVQLSRDADFSQSATIDADITDNVITVSPSALEEAYYGTITKNPAATTLYLRSLLYTVTGGEAEAIIGTPGQNFFATQSVAFTPEFRANISPAYYIVGGPNDWAASAAEKPIKFQHSDKDVYEDPVFTVIFDAAAEGDTWFAIGDDEACAAIGEGTWNKLLGIVGGNSQATEGQLDFRYNMGADNSFCVPAGTAKKIKVTIDMLDYTFRIETVNVADNYYIVGGPLDWAGSAASKEQKFSHSSASVADDPVFTYVFEGTGGDIWFAIGDDEACDAIANDNDWSKLYGTTAGNGENGMTGSLARRSSLSDDGSFKIDGTAKFIRVQINMAELTYTITPLNFDPVIYFIGATDGWNNDEPNRQKLALTDESGVYTGFLYCADPNGWGNEFKFQKVAGDWGTEINTGHITGGITGDFADGGGNFKATAGEGVYYVTLDMANLTLNAVKVEKMGIIGDFNGWGADAEMTWNATDFCYEATNPGITDAGWKFRINAGWDINLGGDNLGDLVANGANLTAVGTTVKLYPTRKTSEKIFCTVE